ncbi:IS3 family transposase, partial [Escherichia coli]|nr:IS3 family transposase [Escherichia coli]MED8080452.1 IS3 family transposase [Escherichia coli]MED8118978.1 IS3 family transposase [Escherichia coli]MED8123840.1 IS3 family transposase [Escherichia coli]MED8128750.1 IS3 family transposase [Escherichia coli]
GHAGIISTAKLFQLSHTSLSHWINLFLLHGPRALDCRYRRIHCELQKRGLKFSGKTVRKLMQQLGLKSPVRLK